MKIKLREKPSVVFKGKNFITPNVIGYYQNGGIYAELSSGTGFLGNPVFGCTFQRLEDGKAICLDDLSQLFYTEPEALVYIDKNLE